MFDKITCRLSGAKWFCQTMLKNNKLQPIEQFSIKLLMNINFRWNKMIKKIPFAIGLLKLTSINGLTFLKQLDCPKKTCSNSSKARYTFLHVSQLTSHGMIRFWELGHNFINNIKDKIMEDSNYQNKHTTILYLHMSNIERSSRIPKLLRIKIQGHKF